MTKIKDVYFLDFYTFHKSSSNSEFDYLICLSDLTSKISILFATSLIFWRKILNILYSYF